jgi:hypothetical protein
MDSKEKFWSKSFNRIERYYKNFTEVNNNLTDFLAEKELDDDKSLILDAEEILKLFKDIWDELILTYSDEIKTIEYQITKVELQEKFDMIKKKRKKIIKDLKEFKKKDDTIGDLGKEWKRAYSLLYDQIRETYGSLFLG